MQPEFTVRAAETQDIPAILALIKAAFAEHQGKIDPPSSAERKTVAIVREELQAAAAFVAEQEGTIIACIFCEPQADVLYISRLSVLPTHRGQGIAFALMQRVEEEAQERNLSGLTLSVRIELTEQQEYYQRMGYRFVGYGFHDGYSAPTFCKMKKGLR